MRIGVYPGTFDPITKGHLDIILRAAKLVDKLVVGVAGNPGKGPMFSAQERAEMVRVEVNGFADNVEVKTFDCLLIDFAQQCGASVILRGLRAISDFEYEFQMAGMNRNIHPQIETVFLMCSEKYQFISSRFVKEIAKLDGDVSSFVSAAVFEALREKIDSGVEPNIEPRLVGIDPP